MVGNKLFYILFAIVLFLGVLLRVFRLDYLELFGDELDAGYQAYSLLNTGKDYKGNFLPVYLHSFSEWRAPLFIYSMIPFIKLLGLNEFGVRLSSAFFGIFSIFGIITLLHLLKTNKWIILLTVVFIALNPWHIQYSRSGFELTLMSALIIWGLFFLIKSIKNNNFVLLFVSGLLLSLSFYTYNTANVLVPLYIFLIFLIYFRKKIFKKMFVLLVVMFFISLPLLNQIFFGQATARFKLFSIFSNDKMVSEINEYRNIDKLFYIRIFQNKAIYSLRKFVFNYTSAFSSDFLFGMGDVTFRHSLHKVGNLFWIQSLLLILGIIFFIKKNNKSEDDLFWIGFLLISPVASSLTIDGNNHASRLFMLSFPLAYFSAQGIGFLNNLKFKYCLLSIIGLIFIFEFLNYQNYYWLDYRRESWRWWQYGYKEAMLEIDSLSSGFDKVLIENTYEPSLIRYLFWSKTDPQKVFALKDEMNQNIDGFNGFCLDKRMCFVDFGSLVNKSNLIAKNRLYFISQKQNIGGDWDWSVNPPIKNLKTYKKIINPWNEILFYVASL